MALNAGSTENATLQVAFGDQGGGITTHGVYLSSGDTANKHGSINVTGDENNTGTVLAYRNVLGGTSEQNQFFLKTNGDFETTGNIILESTNARVGVPAFGLTIGATPTEDYSITLPPAGPTGADQILQSDANGNLSWVAGGSSSLWELDSGNLQPATDGQGIVIRNVSNTQVAGITNAGVISGLELLINDITSQGSNNLTLEAPAAGAVIVAEEAIVAGSSAHDVPDGASWRIQDSNVWQVPADRNITFPSNAPTARQTGIFVMAGNVTWTGNGWTGPNGTLPTTLTAGSIVPFYVESATSIRIGNPTSFS